MNNPKVFVVTGVKDNWKYTNKLLKCLKNQTYKNFELVLVDDGSTDGTTENVMALFPTATVIKGDGNLWWTGCMFKSFEYALSSGDIKDYILTINNDCTFENDYIDKIVEMAANNPDTVVGSLVVDDDNRNFIVDSGAKIDWLRGKIARAGYKTVSEIPADKTYDRDIDTLTTRGTIYPLKVVKKVGNFDVHHLPHYVSDFEYACRIKNNGYTLMVANTCIVRNDKSRTGSTGPGDKMLSFSEYKKILFSRKSQVNIVDHYYLIRLCCPWYYQPINYVYLVAKLIYVTSFTRYFYPFRGPIVKLRSILLR